MINKYFHTSKQKTKNIKEENYFSICKTETFRKDSFHRHISFIKFTPVAERTKVMSNSNHWVKNSIKKKNNFLLKI